MSDRQHVTEEYVLRMGPLESDCDRLRHLEGAIHSHADLPVDTRQQVRVDDQGLVWFEPTSFIEDGRQVYWVRTRS